jgi:hypothetical protein
MRLSFADDSTDCSTLCIYRAAAARRLNPHLDVDGVVHDDDVVSSSARCPLFKR